jgi:hypothetical protein
MEGFGGEMKVPSGELQNQLFVAEPGQKSEAPKLE